MRVTTSSSVPDVFGQRISRVRKELRARGIDCLLVTCPENIRYLVGFAGSSGWVVVTDSYAILTTDARYVERAQHEQPWLSVDLVTNSLVDCVATRVSGLDVRKFGVEGEHLSYARVEAVQAALGKQATNCLVESTEGIVEQLRVVKDDGELRAIESAAALADAALSHAIKVMHAGMTESELAWLIERWLRENGSTAIPFPVIVASGPNSALPHAAPSDRPIDEGEPVVIDLGARVDDYCSDLTRTVFLGHMDPEFQEMYATVLAAQTAALRGLRPGMSGAEADEIARNVIRGTRFDGLFSHGLGHGVGLEIHERPTLNPRSSDVLLDAMVFTIEPGVYVPGQGGVRIEDTVMLCDGRAHSLGQFDKDNPVVLPKNVV